MEKASKPRKEAKDQREHKFEEQVLKSLCLDETATPEEKFQLLLRKHVESERGARNLKLLEKQMEIVLREKETLQREYNKSVLMRDKLQEVCREQQKLIKSVKNESMQKIREEEERRKESQSKFQTSLNDITQSLSKNNEENLKLRDHNIEMTKKMKFLAEQYHTRELQLEKLNEQVELEAQLHQAKLSKAQVEAAMDKEILIKEKQIAIEKMLQTQKLLKDLSDREKALKEQLHLYTSKYDDFQSSLQKSNDIFATYKIELEKMSKNTKKLEKESLEWKRKWEKSNATLIELATEKKERDEHAARCSKQVEQLQKLLRALQSERTHLYKVLRENNIEIPPMPALPPEPERLAPVKITNSAAEKDKMEVMSKNCAELKQTLANLQSQMKFLNIKGAEAEAQAKQLQQQEDALKKRQNGSNKRKQKSKANKNKNAESTAVKTNSPTVSASSNTNQTEEEFKDTPLDQEVQEVTEKTTDKLPEKIETETEAFVEIEAKTEQDSAVLAATTETESVGQVCIQPLPLNTNVIKNTTTTAVDAEHCIPTSIGNMADDEMLTPTVVPELKPLNDVKNDVVSSMDIVTPLDCVELVVKATENLVETDTAKVSFAEIAASATANISKEEAAPTNVGETEPTAETVTDVTA